MALVTTLDKTRKDLETKLIDSTPLLAFVGAGDLAVEKLRIVGSELNARAAGLNARATDLGTRASKLDAATVRAEAKSRIDDVQAEALAAPQQIRALPGKAQAVLGDYIAGALTTYGELAVRGQTLVGRIRSQQATQDLQHQAKATASQAKATSTTAKKSASRTKSAAKAAGTAAGDAANKVGD